MILWLDSMIFPTVSPSSHNHMFWILGPQVVIWEHSEVKFAYIKGEQVIPTKEASGTE